MSEETTKEENYKDFLTDFLSKSNPTQTKEPLMPSSETEEIKKEIVNEFTPIIKEKSINIKDDVIDYYRANKTDYEELFVDSLPMGEFYFELTKISFRACTVQEIQNFSTYDTNNPFDFKNKLNEIIESCVIFEKADGTYASYVDLYDGDRVWLIYLIREKTFPKGKVLSTTVTYEDKNKEKRTHKLELVRANFELWRNEPIMDFFNTDNKVFEIPTTLNNDETFIVAPPTIGLRNCFDQYMQIRIKKGLLDKEKDSPFFKIAPYLKPRISYMSYDEIQEYETWFKEEIEPDVYSFLFDLVNNHLKIGLRGLKKNMGSTTLRTYKVYPDNLRTLFLLPNAFTLFAKKQDNTKRTSL
jgi:hypothetical protein